jgi:hypothetical protein
MANYYILARNSEAISREDVLREFPGAIVSKDDQKAGKIVTDSDVVLGIEYDGWWAWVSFENNNVISISKYGRNQEAPINHLAEVFDVHVVCEHDEDFPYHEFPVDVKVAEPFSEKDGWQLFEKDGWVYLYNKAHDVYYNFISRPIDETDFDEMIAEAVDEE